MIKIITLLLFITLSYGKTYTFTTATGTPLEFGSTLSNTTVNVPAVIGTTSCTTLRNTAGVMKLRVNSSGVGAYLPVTISWTKPATLVNGANSIPVTIIMGYCARNNLGTVVGGAGGLASPYTFTPSRDNDTRRYWFYGRGTAVVPIGTPTGLYTGAINFSGVY